MDKTKMNKPLKFHNPIKIGVIGSLSLLVLYFIILSIANSFEHAVQQFFEMWYWITLLVIGFGIQIGLYFFIRNGFKMHKLEGTATASVAASGGVSTTAMVACCAHHITDILPIIGLSAVAIFLVKYQTLFIIVGILSNLIGINMMLKIIQDHKLHTAKKGILSKILKFDMKKSLYFTTVFSIGIFLITLFSSL